MLVYLPSRGRDSRARWVETEFTFMLFTNCMAVREESLPHHRFVWIPRSPFCSDIKTCGSLPAESPFRSLPQGFHYRFLRGAWMCLSVFHEFFWAIMQPPEPAIVSDPVNNCSILAEIQNHEALAVCGSRYRGTQWQERCRVGGIAQLKHAVSSKSAITQPII